MYLCLQEQAYRDLINHSESLRLVVSYRIPYFFSTSKEMPGKFMLSYMPRDRTVHEFATVTHEGLRFRGQVFSTLNTLIKWFKEHFREPIPQKLVTPSQATPSEFSLYMSFICVCVVEAQLKSCEDDI